MIPHFVLLSSNIIPLNRGTGPLLSYGKMSTHFTRFTWWFVKTVTIRHTPWSGGCCSFICLHVPACAGVHVHSLVLFSFFNWNFLLLCLISPSLSFFLPKWRIVIIVVLIIIALVCLLILFFVVILPKLRGSGGGYPSAELKRRDDYQFQLQDLFQDLYTPPNRGLLSSF